MDNHHEPQASHGTVSGPQGPHIDAPRVGITLGGGPRDGRGRRAKDEFSSPAIRMTLGGGLWMFIFFLWVLIGFYGFFYGF